MRLIKLIRFGVALVPLCLSVGLLWLANVISGERYYIRTWGR